MLAVALVVTIATSLVIYRKWWRGFLAWPRRERQRRFWGDVHRLAGVWSLWFIALIALTGLWYLVESLGGDAGGHAPVLAEQPPASPPTGPIATITPGAVDRAVALAAARWPGLSIERIALSEAGLTLEGQAEAWLVRDRANAIGTDVAGSRLTGTRAGVDLGVHHRISEMADPLHFGTFGGLATQVIWFVFGLLMTALSVTGAYLYGIRVAEAHRPRRGRDAAAVGVVRESAA
jgi:uncharacterized iron-regulated membrane protein